MKYKEFIRWCNERAADGCWSMATAIYCIDITEKINKLPFWKREKEWQKISEFVVDNVVKVIDEKRKDVRNDRNNKRRS